MHERGHIDDFLDISGLVCNAIDAWPIEQMARELSQLQGRLFVLGVGGSAANASHAVNDFRKLCGVDAYAPTDNVAEITARTNDDGFNSIFSNWLRVSRLNNTDAIFILSVGGGNREKNISTNLIEAIDLARKIGAKVFGIVGRDDGYTAKNADIVACIPNIKEKWVTPISEAFQAVIWHALVSHPILQKNSTKW